MEDGEGSLEDGTRFKRESGETKGKNGYWYRWTKLSGISPLGQASSLLFVASRQGCCHYDCGKVLTGKTLFACF